MTSRFVGRGALVAIVLASVAALGGVGAPAAAAPYCGIAWGSSDKHGPGSAAVDPGPNAIVGLRAGRHECYDRLVLDLTSPSADYSVRYVPQVLEDPTGNVVPLAGGARLHIVVSGAPAGWNETPRPLSMPDVTGYRTFRQVAFAGSFEHITSFGLGVRAQLPFRVVLLGGPGSGSRLVVDVAHAW